MASIEELRKGVTIKLKTWISSQRKRTCTVE